MTAELPKECQCHHDIYHGDRFYFRECDNSECRELVRCSYCLSMSQTIEDLNKELKEMKMQVSAPRAEVITQTPDERIELRYQDGELDEVVVRSPEMVHFEVMSDQSIWCGIYAGDKSVRVWICSKNGRSHVSYSAEIETGSTECPTPVAQKLNPSELNTVSTERKED